MMDDHLLPPETHRPPSGADDDLDLLVDRVLRLLLDELRLDEGRADSPEESWVV